MANQDYNTLQGLEIKTPEQYRQHLKERAVNDFLVRLINYARGNRHYYLARNRAILLQELESIDNASFESGIDDEPPF